ncbi:MAG: hypothetical protein VX264_05175 [Chloroflexota bacterium]|nr:hypothetical protein [Chloroflexota bacterium]
MKQDIYGDILSEGSEDSVELSVQRPDDADPVVVIGGAACSKTYPSI